MPDRTLLVLGASLYQVPVIVRAKEMGLRVVTADYVPTSPGHALADASHVVDTTNAEGILAVARQEKIDGVIAACTDVAVPTAAFVAKHLGLRAPGWRAASILCDKIAFRTWQHAEGLPAPRFHEGTEWPGDGAWIVKPARASGSKGIFVVRSREELEARRAQALEHGKRALVEELYPGVQLTCEGFLRNGRPELAWVTRRETAPEPYVATWGHRLPSGLADERPIVDAVVDVLGRLDVTDGPFDADLVWDGSRAVVLEATPRLGGNSLATLFRVATGFDFVSAVIAHAIGDEPQLLARAATPAAIVLLGVDRAGALRYDVRELEALREEPWVVSLVLDKAIGDPALPFTDGRRRVGEAIVTAPDRIDELRRRLDLAVTP